MKVSDAVLDAAMRLEVMGLDESQSRRLMLKEMLKRSKRSPRKGGFAGTNTSFSDSLKLVGITLAIKKNVFSKEAAERRRRTGTGAENESENVSAEFLSTLPNRWSADNISDEDALLFAKLNLENGENSSQQSKPPQPFVDILPLSHENPIKSGTVSDI